MSEQASSSDASGADRLVHALEQSGVDVVFGLPGVHNLPIWKALHGSQIRLIGVRHEQAAVYAADGFNRATGRLGVALVTTGPGAANTAGAIGEAMASGSSVLLVASDVATTFRRPGVNRGVLHESPDQASIFRSITKAAVTIERVDEIWSATIEGARRALQAPAAPVYMGIPTDLLSERAGSGGPADLQIAEASDSHADLEISRAVDLIEAAERVVVWAGGGALRSGAASKLAELAERLVAPVLTTYAGRGILPPSHPCLAPGPAHAPPIGNLWDEADLVIAVGTDFDGMATQNWLMPQPRRLLAVNVDPIDAAKNYRPDQLLEGDARSALSSLLPRLTQRGGSEELARRLGTIGEVVRNEVQADEPGAAQMLFAFDRVLPDSTVVVADMCIPGYWLAGYRAVPLPRKLAYPVGWGTLGFAFPASLGAAIAGVGPTVCVTGDGGFLFACGELATAAQEAIDLTVVLVDDGGYGMLRFDQEHAGEKPFGVDLASPDFAALARSFGVRSSTVEGFGDAFEQRLADEIASAGPSMLVVRAELKPPPTTSPRWYRRQGNQLDGSEAV